MSRSLWKGLLAGAIGGAVGSWAKALAEPPLQRLGERIFPPLPGEKEQLGADITGHPANMPPAEMVREATPVPLSRSEVLGAQQVFHYVFGTGAGAAYGALAEVAPVVTVGAGVPAGAALWAGTHGSVVPALGFQADVDDEPEAWWVWEFGSHLVYGLTAEIVRRAVRARL